jgi:hypothetical protein
MTYIRRTAPLTSRRCILYIYSTNILTEYFKHAAHSPFFPLQNAVYFIMLPFLVHVFKRKFRRLKVNAECSVMSVAKTSRNLISYILNILNIVVSASATIIIQSSIIAFLI